MGDCAGLDAVGAAAPLLQPIQRLVVHDQFDPTVFGAPSTLDPVWPALVSGHYPFLFVEKGYNGEAFGRACRFFALPAGFGGDSAVEEQRPQASFHLDRAQPIVPEQGGFSV